MPENPPAVIHLEAVAEDYQGNQRALGADFPTGEVWNGKITGQLQAEYCTTTSISGNLSLVVADDGTVTGTGQTITTPSTCTPPDASYSVPSASEGLTITGQKTKTEFTLQTVFAGSVTAPTMTLPIHGRRAVGDLPESLTGGHVTETYSLTCQTCGH